ncbi:MAG: META domain-containing protein [Mucispirillum sp.]|nr:META domain-containing protein [Mucispirillum sp.]
MKKLIFSSVLLSLFLLGCKAGNMEEMLNKKEYKLASNPKITIGFDNGSVFGSSGVNRYIGSYTIKDGSITFSNLGSTMMMGPQEDMDNETKYLAGLKESLAVKFDKENNLIIGRYLFIPLNK